MFGCALRNVSAMRFSNSFQVSFSFRGGVIYNVHRDTETSVKVQYCLFHTQTSLFNDFISQPLRQYVILH